MCQCTPELRTPWCGKPGCGKPGREEPKQEPLSPEQKLAHVRSELLATTRSRVAAIVLDGLVRGRMDAASDPLSLSRVAQDSVRLTDALLLELYFPSGTP